MTNKELIEHIKKEILGIPKYGFEDEAIWGDFIEENFTRSGVIDGEAYSAHLNEVLSSAAVSHVLNHLRIKLDELSSKEG